MINKKARASMQILLLIVGMFAFVYLIYNSSAVRGAILSEPSVCCEKLKDKNVYCINEQEVNCDSSYKKSPTSCEATSYCKQGTCYDSSEGICMENTPQIVCEQEEGTWDERSAGELPQCQLGCCVIADQAAFVPLVRCKKLSSLFGVEIDYRTNIASELECIATAQAQDLGACVFEKDFTRTCKFTTRADCNAQEIVEAVGLETTSEKGFYKDYLCSAEELNTECARQVSTGCYQGKVYWVDSCGNRENVYSSNKDKSWNNGRVAEPDEICPANNGDTSKINCGNCDYLEGSRCAEYEKGMFSAKPQYGDYFCKNTKCIDREGNVRLNGESWCVYDSGIANGADPAGSRHFKETCVDGSVRVEPCAEYRNEICIQGEVDIESEEKDEYSNAACRVNRWQDCTQQTEQDDCENVDRRDCRWIPGIYGLNSMCVPDIPPGFEFWEEGDAEAICAQANTQIVVKFGKNIFGDTSCEDNCDCNPREGLDERCILELNNMCKSLGDCGGYINYVGKYTDDGYTWHVNGEEREFSQNSVNKIKSGAKEVSTIIGMAILEILPLVSAGDKVVTYDPNDVEGVGLLKDYPDYAASQGMAAVSTAQTATDAANKITPPPTPPKTPTTWDEFLALIYGPENSKRQFLWKGLGWITLAYSTSRMLGSLLGMSKNQQEALSEAATWGTLTWYLFKAALKKGGMAEAKAGAVAGWIGVGIAVLYFLVTYKKEFTNTIVFECKPWQAPNGGSDCEKCNDPALPCSEYRCKSLGQSCELLNKGTEDEKCVHVSPRDFDPPSIKPNELDLTDGYGYTDVKLSPPGPGFRIIKTGGECIGAFTPLKFGIITDEPAQCKIDFNHTEKFDDMSYWFGETNLYLYNHTQQFSLPGSANLENLEIQHDGKFTFYVRCKDKNGNENSAEYAVRFCVDPSPDTTAPQIKATSIATDSCVAENMDNAEVEFYINEPAECKWSAEDKSYDNMESDMTCFTELYQLNSLQLYTCKADLTGISRAETNFYIRCKDQPELKGTDRENDRNINAESYEFSLRGSNALKMKNLQPNGTIYSGIDPAPVYLSVETLFGCDDGKSICYYSQTGEKDDYIQFYETNDFIHEQRQDLSEGTYTYYYKCIDLGGNVAISSTTFTLEIDTTAPVIARVYEEDSMLKIVTIRDSECAYSLDNCDFTFEEGIEMPYANTTTHMAEWKEDKTYYIKCRDEYRNVPADCSLVVQATKNFL